MGYNKVAVILPGYGLDNLPYDIDDQQAEGLLNAFAAPWHPQLLAELQSAPSWHSCDEFADSELTTLFVIPPISEEYLHGSWLQSGEDAAGVVREVTEREELVAAVLAEAGIAPATGLDADLVADCMALGLAHMLMEVLTQQMHYFTNIDEEILGQHAVEAAKAIVAGENKEAREKLTVAYEVLVEARERFYPVDCYLLDLCLLNAEQANENLAETLAGSTPINLLMEASELAGLNDDILAAIKMGLEKPDPETAARIGLIGGEHSDVAAPLAPLTDWLRDFQRGLDNFDSAVGERPHAWARKRFGFSPLLPQVLKSLGYTTALHFALDDGTYPDGEHSKFSWEGSDGTAIDAISRIPIAIESAGALLKLPNRIAESMQEDMVAAVLFARWPDVKTPWLRDFQRIHSYGQVFGRFVTFDEFAEDSGDPGHNSAYAAREYVTPFLIQGSALGQQRPISRFIQQHQLRAKLDAGNACGSIVRMIRRGEPDSRRSDIETLIDAADEQQPLTPEIATAADQLSTDAVTELATICGATPSKGHGLFAFNSLPFARTVTVDVPAVKGTQTVAAEVPGFGYRWLTADDAGQQKHKAPLATESLMHNGLFELHINEETGAIATIKSFGRSPNRLSTQLAFRFERERDIGIDEEDGEPIRSAYSAMKAREIDVVRSDSQIGEVRVVGDLIDQTDESKLATFEQTIRMVHSSPFVEVDVRFSNMNHFAEGNPWLCYYCFRIAWDDPAASLTRSVFGQAHGFSGERFESPHYLEIASDDRRTTLISHGSPFWRKTGMRQADSVMVVEGEEERHFRYTIAIDQAYPHRAAMHAMTPPLTLPTRQPSARSGWFVRSSAKNVAIIDIRDTDNPNSQIFRLMETEGRAATTKLTLFRNIKSAHKLDLSGNEGEQLAINKGAAVAPVRGYELCDIEIDFGA